MVLFKSDKKSHPFIGRTQKGRKNKYNAKKVIVEGKTCDSKKEAEHYGKLLLAERAGEISDLKFHPRYPLYTNGQKIGICELDFEYNDKGTIRYVDVKGVYLDFSKWKHKHFKAQYGHKVEIWK